ncbi:MAG: cupredoxin domain-containing protein [Sphingomonadaceae bacterium]|nr:cupredoxin domain-containing protein [Sphingomonadaceae bacterium]
MQLHLLGVTALASLMAVAPSAQADDPPTFRLTLKNHAFSPAEIDVPAGKRLVLVVHNADDTPAEFESRELGAEKVISAGREALIRVGPLAAGRYPFADEFHQDQARGALIAAGE